MNKKLRAASFGMLAAVAIFFAPVVKADSWDGVILTGNYLSDYYLENNEASTFHGMVGNYSGSNQSVKIWLGLYDSSHNLLDSQTWDNQWINTWNETHFMMSSPNDLEHGNYYYSVKLFKGGTNDLVREYNHQQGFTVAIDYSAPQVNLEMPWNGQEVWGNMISFKGTAMDWESGVDKVAIHDRTTGTTHWASYDMNSHHFHFDLDVSTWMDGYHGFDIMAYNGDGITSYNYVGVFLK